MSTLPQLREGIVPVTVKTRTRAAAAKLVPSTQTSVRKTASSPATIFGKNLTADIDLTPPGFGKPNERPDDMTPELPTPGLPQPNNSNPQSKAPVAPKAPEMPSVGEPGAGSKPEKTMQSMRQSAATRFPDVPKAQPTSEHFNYAMGLLKNGVPSAKAELLLLKKFPMVDDRTLSDALSAASDACSEKADKTVNQETAPTGVTEGPHDSTIKSCDMTAAREEVVAGGMMEHLRKWKYHAGMAKKLEEQGKTGEAAYHNGLAVKHRGEYVDKKWLKDHPGKDVPFPQSSKLYDKNPSRVLPQIVNQRNKGGSVMIAARKKVAAKIRLAIDPNPQQQDPKGQPGQGQMQSQIPAMKQLLLQGQGGGQQKPQEQAPNPDDLKERQEVIKMAAENLQALGKGVMGRIQKLAKELVEAHKYAGDPRSFMQGGVNEDWKERIGRHRDALDRSLKAVKAVSDMALANL